MIGSLSGTIKFKAGEQVIIDAGGVGYEVSVTSSVLSRAGDLGGPIDVIVFTDVKETSISLFGFSSFSEREVFLLLRKVKGIGSKLALSILSSMGSEQLLICIGQGDVAALKKVPGVGNKMAERLIVELRESVGDYAKELPTLSSKIEIEFLSDVPLPKGVFHDAVLALEKLGFSEEKSKHAVNAALEKLSDTEVKKTDASELLRLALANLS